MGSQSRMALQVLAVAETTPKIDPAEREVRYRKDGTPWTYSPPLNKRGVSRKVKEDARKQLLAKTTRQINKLPQDFDKQNLLGDELVAWSQSPGAEMIEDFPLSKGYSPYKFYRLAEQNEYFADCLDSALSRLGSRMHRAARKREEDGAVIMKTFPLYNREYRSLSLEKANAMASKGDTIIQVIEDKIPSSLLVPPRDSDNLD